VVNAGSLNALISGGTAAKMDEHRVIGKCQINVIVTRTANRAHIRNMILVGENRHHSGDAALYHHFIDDIRLGKSAVRQSLTDVVDHNGNRALPDGGFTESGVAGQRIENRLGRRRLLTDE